MADINTEIVTWLKSLSGWQTELAYRLLGKDSLSSTDYSEIINMIKSNSAFVDKDFPKIGNNASDGGVPVRLKAIKSISGIEKLAPKKPILFENSNMVVIYGNNGSGKSGITRILKKACGKPNAKQLKANVFKSPTGTEQCIIIYTKGDRDIEATWQINGAKIDDLSVIDIYDADTGASYIKDSKSVSYTPRSVALFESLSREFGVINGKLTVERDALIKKLPTLPSAYSSTQAYRVYNGTNSSQLEKSLSGFEWDEGKEKELKALTERLNQKNPLVSAQEKRKNKTEAENILRQLESAISQSSIAAYEKIKVLREDAGARRKVAQESAAVFKEKVELSGVGTPTWNALWEAARKYSTEEAYKGFEFPNTNDGSRCVLCHQPLGKDAKDRINTFNTFVTSTLENEAKKAESAYREAIGILPKPIEEADIATKCNAAALDENWYEQLKNVWLLINKNVADIVTNKESIADVSFLTDTAVSALKAYILQKEKEAVQFDADAATFDRDKALQSKLELEATKLCSEHKSAILEEIARLKKVAQFSSWINETGTTAISRKASQVSEAVITEDYIKRFNNELKRLGAHKIQVELVRHSTTRGVPYHAVKIKGAPNCSPADIFSEGEFRIISLAAFLADVTGGNNNNAFIFDDPISSLDQDYEEATITRLAELSHDRQVIVFTHRLSLLGMLHEKCTKRMEPPIGISVVGLKAEVWGTGEPGDLPFYGKPKAEFNKIKDQKLPVAKRALESDGQDFYYPLAKSICSDIRNLIERTIEYVLLADVIVRHRRSVMTEGKIKNLAKISLEDCALMEEFMTKYSRYEHSQPLESPVQLPEPAEIDADIIRIQAWLAEFEKRAMPANIQA